MSRILLAVLLAGAAAIAGPRLGRFTVDTGEGHFRVDGKPFQVIAGELHYLRIPPEYWKDRLIKARAMGLNTIATYSFWNAHEPKPGEWDFSGGRDVARFVKMAQEVGLYVILRPGPYGCAEWEFGAFPWWLLKEHDLLVRSMDERYLRASERWLKRLGQELGPLQNTRGGPVVMVQFENEYGSFSNDKVYLGRVQRALDDAGFDIPKFTSDGGKQMPDGYLPGVVPTINGALGQEVIDTIQKFLPKGPFMVAEFYPGWIDHWGSPHSKKPAVKTADQLDWLLRHGVSVNLYMFHGGTTFGFMNGANYKTKYDPQPTSYDSDAPLDESGRVTPKYWKYREVIEARVGRKMPVLPVTPEPIAVGPVTLGKPAYVFANLPAAVKAERPLSMEDVGQGYGYILYRTRVEPGAGKLEIRELRDYGVVYLDGRQVAVLDRRKGESSVELEVKTPGVLEIFVENMGRINYGPEMVRNRKGITERVTLAGRELTGWEMVSLPMTDVSAKALAKTGPQYGPVVRRGTFRVARVGDTFLDMRGFGKGCVFVNGRNLGRFWGIGPQQTLYLPGIWMKAGVNEVVVVEVVGTGAGRVSGIKRAILDEVRP